MGCRDRDERRAHEPFALLSASVCFAARSTRRLVDWWSWPPPAPPNTR